MLCYSGQETRFFIGNKAYGTFEAEEKAKEFIEHLLEHESYPPLKYPSNPNLPLSAYPDVTEEVFKKIDRIASLLYLNRGSVLKIQLLHENFPNNRKWDFQVGHDLPGQVLKDNKIQKDSNGNIITIDQYALFKNKIRRSGYISNFTYGYASASAQIDEGAMINVAQAISIWNNGRLDNEEDLEAAKEGWREWHQRYRLKIRF